MRVVSSVLVLSWLVSACSPDLGTCDMAMATAPLVYLEGTPYVEGQALIFQSCAGSQCHALAATGIARTGAPHGLNFDVSPITKTSTQASVDQLNAGISEVRDEAETLWRVIENGSMPPGKAGDRSDLHWTDKTGTTDVMLTGLDLAEARDKVRNWLACAAPIIAATNDAPLKDQLMGLGATADPGTPPMSSATFSSIYSNVLAGCTGCHNAAMAYPGQALDLSSPDTAYTQLVDKPTFSGSGAMCGGRTLVKTNDCANSVLWQKLVPMGMKPPCGMAMPLGGTAISDANRKAVCDWINAGALR